MARHPHPVPLPEGEGKSVPFTPEAPEWRLAPTPPEAAELDARWRSEGEFLSALVPVSLPGVKTRFDELLVDEDPRRLLARLPSATWTGASFPAATTACAARGTRTSEP